MHPPTIPASAAHLMENQGPDVGASSTSNGAGYAGGGFSFSHSERDVPIHHLPEDVQQKLLRGGGHQPALDNQGQYPHGGSVTAAAATAGRSAPLMTNSSHYEYVPPSNWRPDDDDLGDDFLGLYRR